MKNRSKKEAISPAAAESVARSRRLREPEPAKPARPSKRRTTAKEPPAASTTREKSAAPHGLVRFEFLAPSAREVFLAGTFNDWNFQATPMTRAKDGKWSKELTLYPGTYEYRFVVDGQWTVDPNNMERVANPFGENNSLLVIGPFGQTG